MMNINIWTDKDHPIRETRCLRHKRDGSYSFSYSLTFSFQGQGDVSISFPSWEAMNDFVDNIDRAMQNPTTGSPFNVTVSE